VFAKDLLLDFRTRDRLGHMAVFALLVVALLSIVVPASRTERLAWSPALPGWCSCSRRCSGSRARSSRDRGRALALLVRAVDCEVFRQGGERSRSSASSFGPPCCSAFLDVD
jgi:hypothetical protein